MKDETVGLKVSVTDWVGFIVVPFALIWILVVVCAQNGISTLIGAGGGVGLIVILAFIELRTIISKSEHRLREYHEITNKKLDVLAAEVHSLKESRP